MNDSIEIPRGGDNKRPGRGRGGRRLPRSSRQEEQGTGSPTGGEDTTEIPRSTTQVSMQLTMERMRRAAPARKLNKAPGQGEECSKSENTVFREIFAFVSFSDKFGKFKPRSISLEV